MINSLFRIILLSLCISIDNFLIGLNVPNIPILGIILISFMNTFVTFVSIFFGTAILKIIPVSILKKIACFVFLYLAYKEITKSDKVIEHKQNNYDMSFSFIFMLGLATSFTNFSGGIAAGIAKFPIFKTTFICFIISFILMKSGQILGNLLKKFVTLNFSAIRAISFFFIALQIGYN